MHTYLTMHELMRSGENPKYGTGPIFKYKVDGLPSGQDAFIVNVNVGRPRGPLWRIDVGAKRTGNYKTAEEALAALQAEMDEVRNEKTWYAVCPEWHVPLFDRRPRKYDTCTFCDVPKRLTAVGQGFVSRKEKNRGVADSLPLKTLTAPTVSRTMGSSRKRRMLLLVKAEAGNQFSNDELLAMVFLLLRNERQPSP